MRTRTLAEAFDHKRYQEGQVTFPTSSLNDPHIQAIAAKVAAAQGVSVPELFAKMNEGIAKFQETAKLAPTLYHTISQNIIENELFQAFQKVKVQTGAPKFSNITFQKLMRSIRADHDEFFPLRSFIDKRRLINPKFTFDEVDENAEPDPQSTKKLRVPTAAATPGGEFIFNIPFMQKLMDYSNLKGIKPKGRKYVNSGGDIPDEYGYIEFLIMHEFMHYSNDDFYYQKIIPGANAKIINWVGDFRSNYTLTKSGYEALPIGLFNDKINYDRQKTYIEMYNLVKSEFDKLPKSLQDMLQDALDKLSDDHGPGNAQGEKEDMSDKGEIGPGDIDANGKRIQKEMQEGKDSTPSDRGKEKSDKGKDDKSDEPGNQKNAGTSDIDYKQVMPRFNWRTLVQRFIMSAKPKVEETYSKPHRRSVTGTHIISQVGAAAVKPAERPQDFSDSSLAFIIDSSGSMSGVIAQVFSNAMNLLKQPAFRKTEQTVLKFSGGYEIFKVNFANNKAGKVENSTDKPKKYDMKTTDVFSQHFGAGTVFDAATAAQILALTKTKHNCIFFLDSDILWGGNKDHFLALIKAAPAQMFVVFDSRQTWLAFRQASGISTANITYFQ